APDRRLATLPTQYERLVGETGGPLPAERGRPAGGRPPGGGEGWGRGGARGVRDGRCPVFDWGDACVAHPFLSMAVTLEGALAWGLDDVEGSVDVTPFRDAYLPPVGRYEE